MSRLSTHNDFSGSGKTDFNLITTRLKQMALKGDKTDKCLSILKNTRIRNHLDPDLLQTWSELALVIGEIDLALEILTWINDNHPQAVSAWKERIDLLQRLNRREEALKVRSRAVLLHPETKHEFETYVQDIKHVPEPEIEAPFELMREHKKLLELYLNFFQGREDVFARQWADKSKDAQGYVPVRRPLTAEDVLDHIKGRKTYGIYLLRRDATVGSVVIDMDLNRKLRATALKSQDRLNIKREKDYIFARVEEMSQERLNIRPLCEFSGNKGFHFWFFFDKPVSAGVARKLISPVAAALNRDCQCFSLEVFPKQDQLQGKGLGNLVKLPLGVHRLSGKPSYFVGSPRNDPWMNISRLEKFSYISGKIIDSVRTEDRKAGVVLHPGYGKWAENYPELYLLSENCPPLGKIFTALRNKKEISLREEKILFQTIGFLARANHLLHHLLKDISGYNSHLVNYKLSKIRGTPLGCKKIHQLLEVHVDYCRFDEVSTYHHPLLHCRKHLPVELVRSEKIENLNDALDHLKTSLDIVIRFLPQGKK